MPTDKTLTSTGQKYSGGTSLQGISFYLFESHTIVIVPK